MTKEETDAYYELLSMDKSEIIQKYLALLKKYKELEYTLDHQDDYDISFGSHGEW